MGKANYSVGDPKAEQLIDELVEFCANPEVENLLREIFTTVVKMGLEHEDRGDFKLTNTTLKELRHSFRVFLKYRDRKKVVVFGSSRTDPSDPCYKLAEDLARALVKNGFMIITGAGPGIMAAANRGAGAENSFGINIKLPMEQAVNSFIAGDSKLMHFKYFFTRKLMLLKESHATVLFPGGFGTQDEGFENLTLFQTGKSMPRPILLMEPKKGTYWKHWRKYLEKELLAKGYISPMDFNLFKTVHSVEEAVAYIQDYYSVFHSLRYVGDATVLRFRRDIPEPLVAQLNDEYAGILEQGRISQSPPLEIEIENNEFPDLHRLVLNFNKRDFGKLNEMILKINQSLKPAT